MIHCLGKLLCFTGLIVTSCPPQSRCWTSANGVLCESAVGKVRLGENVREPKKAVTKSEFMRFLFYCFQSDVCIEYVGTNFFPFLSTFPCKLLATHIHAAWWAPKNDCSSCQRKVLGHPNSQARALTSSWKANLRYPTIQKKKLSKKKKKFPPSKFFPSTFNGTAGFICKHFSYVGFWGMWEQNMSHREPGSGWGKLPPSEKLKDAFYSPKQGKEPEINHRLVY